MAASSEEPFAFAVSLGQFCITANTLRESSRRKFSTPFDWCYSNVDTVTWCLNDDFSAYTNLKFYTEVSNDKNDNRSGHHMFSRFLGRKVVFNHHNPLREGSADLQYFNRCASRFRIVLQSKRRKLFVMTCRDSGKNKESTMNKLFSELTSRTSNFTLLIVYLLHGARGREMVSELQDGNSRMEIYNVHCQGGHSGLYFKEEEDRQLYEDTICEGRSFELAEDPLTCQREHGRAGKFGDLDVEASVPLDRRKRSSDVKKGDSAPLGKRQKCSKVSSASAPTDTVASGEVPDVSRATDTVSSAPDAVSSAPDAVSSAPDVPDVPTPNGSAELALPATDRDQGLAFQPADEVVDLLTQAWVPLDDAKVGDVDMSDPDMEIQWPAGFGPKRKFSKVRRIIPSYFPVLVEDSEGVVEIEDADPIVDLTNVEDEDKRILEVLEQDGTPYPEIEDFDSAHDEPNEELDSLIKKFKEGDEMDFFGAEALLPTSQDFALAQALHCMENEVFLVDGEEPAQNERDFERQSYQRDLDTLTEMGFARNKATATLLRCGCNFNDALDALLRL